MNARHSFFGLCMLWLAGIGSACTGWAQDANGLAFGGSQGVRVFLPSAPPFDSLGSFRWEMRLRGFALNHPNSQRVFETAETLSLSIVPNSTTLRLTNFLDGGGESMLVDLAGRDDIVIRIQRDLDRKRITFEIWDADGSRPLDLTPQPITGVPRSFAGWLALGQNGFGGERLASGQITYFRWIPGVLPRGSAPPGYVAAGATLARYELETDLLDSSGAGLHLSSLQPPIFSAVPVVALLPYSFSTRAGHPFQIDASPSGASAYFWQQLSGPVPVTFSSRSVATPVISGADAFGSYVFQLRVTGVRGDTSTRQIKVGAVPTNRDGVVLVADSKVDVLLGPQLRDGVGPWPYYDTLRRRMGHLTGMAYPGIIQTDFNMPATGTVSVTPGSATVTGVGTSFQTLFQCNGAEEYLVADYAGVNGNPGIRLLPVASCPSNTSIQLYAAYNGPALTGQTYRRWDASTGKRWTEGINYYDSVLVHYQNWYRTGIDDFLNYARTLADAWWRSPQINNGLAANDVNLGIVPPRRAALDGLILRALDGRPEFFPWMKEYVDAATFTYLSRFRANSFSAFGLATREPGYVYLFLTLLAQVHPDAAVRQYYTGLLTDFANTYWAPWQCQPGNPPQRCQHPLGAFRWPDPGFYEGNAEVLFHNAIAMEGLAKAHRYTADPALATVIDRWLRHVVSDYSGNEPLWQTGPSGFDQRVRCRMVQYWAYSTPFGPQTNSQGNQTAGASCPTVDLLRDNRAANNELPNIYGYAFATTGTAFYRDFGDEVFAATFGGETGPRSDGYIGRADSGLSDQGKQHGQSFRSSGTFLASRLKSSTAAALLPMFVNFKLASSPGAVEVRITASAPNGRTFSASCPSSPCAVDVDRTQGAHRLQFEYLDSGGRVLAVASRLNVQVAP